MAEYFFILDAAQFDGRVRPALAGAWRSRHFEPVRGLCAELLPAARAYAERYHTRATEPLLTNIAAGTVPFDRDVWRSLVAEVLLFGALEIPEFPVNAETLTCLLAPGQYREPVHDRALFPPVTQALEGTRDLTFGAAVYRPEDAGYNNAADVKRLADYLAAVRTEAWTAADLAGLRELPEEDHGEELAYVRECFPALAEMYRRAADDGRAIVHESIF
jgi:hypothetical protein